MKNFILILFITLFSVNITAKDQPFTCIVASDESGTHTSVQAAIDACPEGEIRSLIFIKNGIYKEMVNVPATKKISLIGESRDGVLITFDRDRGPNSEYTDFRDITTCQFYGEDMYVEGLTIENSAGNVGQAEAHYVAKDRQTYKNCRFLGYQDTQRTNNGARAYFKNCWVEGAVDFIFGGGMMYYDDCTINCVNGGGYIAAPAEYEFIIKKSDTATNRILRFNYIFRNCDITANADVQLNTYYLGRPWKETSGTYYINCKIGNHIKPAGWREWNGNEATACFGEYANRDLNGNMLDINERVNWSFQLAQVDAEKFTPDFVFGKANPSKTYDPVSLCKNPASPSYAEYSQNNLEWTAVEGAIGYIILKDGKFFDSVTGTTYTDQSGIKGFYSIKSIAEHGALSNPVRVENVDNQLLKAFPTAEGFGKLASGGRGGRVVIVTNLEDDAAGSIEGSFRWALNQYTSDFTVVFAVSGRIELVAPLKAKKKNFTVAGQTAPGDGICITGNLVSFGGSENFIIRHIRFRVGQLDSEGNIIAENCLNVENCSNFIIDHCSLGWSVEENMNSYDDKFHTIQWCILHEGLYNSGHPKGARGYGAQWGGSQATYHHNLLAHNRSRSPRFNGAQNNDMQTFIEYINNVNYNWGSSGAVYGGENEGGARSIHELNMINNYYKPGPATPSDTYFVRPSYIRDGYTSNGPSQWHLSGNVMVGSPEKTQDNWKGVRMDAAHYTVEQMKVDTIIIPNDDVRLKLYKTYYHDYTYNTYETAEAAYESVLAHAGALPRDPVDSRIINEVSNGLAPYGNKGIIDVPSQVGGYPVYETFDMIVDNDEDGMDDAWEIANGLNPNDPNDRNLLTDLGYTALEVYLNSLVGEVIKHDFTTGIFQTKEEDQLMLENTIVTNELSISEISNLEGVYIFNMNGMKVLSAKLKGKNTVQLNNLFSGHYIIVGYTETGEIKTTRFLKK